MSANPLARASKGDAFSVRGESVGRRLLGLEHAIGVSFVDPIRDRRSWAFTGDPYVDPVNEFDFLSDAYLATDPDYRDRVSVPVLWDKHTGVIVNNESADILRMLSTVFLPLTERPVELYPEPLRDEIDQLNDYIYDNDRTHGMINPRGLVAMRPAADWSAPPSRAGLGLPAATN